MRVAILMGGRSSEHDISLKSAQSVVEALDPERYDVVAVEIGRDGRWELGGGTRELLPTAETLPVPAAGNAAMVALAGVEVARCKVCWSWPACRMSAPASPRPRSAWTRTS